MLLVTLAILMTGSLPAAALDLFTLWRQPMLPLNMTVGGWADYSSISHSRGQRNENLVRIQCVEHYGSDETGGWVVELLPLGLVDQRREPLPGEGLRLYFSQRLLRRDAPLMDVVEKVERWEGGQGSVLDPTEWRENPFVSSSLRAEFTPDSSELISSSVRVVDTLELLCDHFQMTALDTQRVQLHQGHLEQVSSWEITAAVNDKIPFLGVAFAAERTHAESRLDPPSERFTAPAPVTKVETMELVAFGDGALPCLKTR